MIKQIFKIALLCIAAVGALTSCEKPVTKDQAKYAINFTPSQTGGTVEVTVDGKAIKSGDKFAAGTEVSVKAVADAELTFTVWKYAPFADKTAAEATFTMPEKDVALVATFSPIEKGAINFDAAPVGGGIEVKVDGTAISSGARFPEGTPVTVVATEASGYTFDGWSGVTFQNPADAENREATFYMPASDVTLTATFTLIPNYSITISDELVNGTVEIRVNGGNPITSGAEFPAGVEVQVKATAAQGATITDPSYAFKEWAITGTTVTGNANPVTFTLGAGDVVVNAVFEEIPADFVMIGGARWAKYNVGAPNTFVENEQDYGLYYQWGQKVGWSKSGTPDPEGSTWVTGSNSATSWTSANNPCPSGYAVPTVAQYNALIAACTLSEETVGGINGRKFTATEGGATLFFPYAGYYSSQAPVVGTEPTGATTTGNYWTADPNSTSFGPTNPTADYIPVNSATITKSNQPRPNMYPVRCVLAQ